MKTILRGVVFIAAGCATAPSLAPAPADALAPRGTAGPTNSAVTMFYESLALCGDWLWGELLLANAWLFVI